MAVQAPLTAAANGAEHGLGTLFFLAQGAKHRAQGNDPEWRLGLQLALSSVLARLWGRGHSKAHWTGTVPSTSELGAGCLEQNWGNSVKQRGKFIIMSF